MMPAPAPCPGWHSCCVEVRALKAWKAEAMERGAEMALRGLAICAERDALKAEVERLEAERELYRHWVLGEPAFLAALAGRR